MLLAGLVLRNYMPGKARFRRRTFHEPKLTRIKADQGDDPNYLDRLN